MRQNPEFEHFNSAMDAILRADPKAVKEALERESKTLAAERSVRGERKRGKRATKKQPSVSAHVSNAKD